MRRSDREITDLSAMQAELDAIKAMTSEIGAVQTTLTSLTKRVTDL